MGRSKYNVSRDTACRTYNDIVFDSKMEMEFYIEIVEPGLKSGEIQSCEMQKKYVLQPKAKRDWGTIRAINHVVDFYLVYEDGTCEVVDVKGAVTPEAKIKKKLFLYRYPETRYTWVVKRRGEWIERGNY